jgi:hypothetical protein
VRLRTLCSRAHAAEAGWTLGVSEV